MNKPRQTTLFQSWQGPKQSSQTTHSGSNTAKPSTSSTSQSGTDQFGDEDEDEDLLRAMELSLQESLQSGAAFHAPDPVPATGKSNSSAGLFSSVHGKNEVNRPTQVLSELNNNSRQKSCNPSSLGLFKKNQPKQGTLLKYSERNEIPEKEQQEEPQEDLTEEQLAALEDIPGFDKGAGQMWIYPTNFPVREYQFNIVKEALFTNTLVVLPTGLGKTFIAAVIMYNFYRWYPQGKVIFMAPTKPLVAQQIEACYNIMGIPQSDAAEMTGAMQPAERKLAWKSRRIFFLTPQVLTNDLSREACPGRLVKCLVIDEAHKSQGNHAYCQVVKELAKYEGEFRVLALSATPGSDMKAVQQVITNVMISHVELRGEDSPDIKQYTHERRVEKVVVPLGQELTAVKEKYLRVMNTVVNRLKRLGVVYNREVTSLSKFLILKSRDAFRQNPPHNLPNQQFGAVEGDFALAISLYHGYDLLQQHGLRSLQSYLLSLVNGEKGYGRTRAELLRNNDFTDMMEAIKRFTPVKNTLPCTQVTLSASQLAKPYEVGHPKLAKLEEIALEHFANFQGGPDNAAAAASTRIMVFAQYRDTVSEITELLNRHHPLIKCMSFIGQSSAGKATKGFTQKEQLLVMKKFRDGGYNTLVSTCVGEEGLDIGDVDLIICFDAHKSPIRLVQRMGRTGRKREGRIIMLVTAGKEEQIYNQSQYTKRSIHKAIQNGARSLVFYPNSSRMVPEGLTPRCHRMHIMAKEAYVQRTKGARTTKAPPRTTKSAAVGRKPVSDGFLTREELQYWSEHYKTKEQEIPKLPTSNFVSLKQCAKRAAPQEGPLLSLSEWMPWQNRLQQTVHVDHSMQSRHLVDVVEFMQIQAAIGGDEDPYGQEMQTFLNKEDVNVKSKPQGMFRYCTPAVATAQPAGKASHVRRSEQLPTFSSEEENLGESSDEDLPTFDGLITKVHLAKAKSTGKKSCGRSVAAEIVRERRVTASEDEDIQMIAVEPGDENPRPPDPKELSKIDSAKDSVSPKGKGKGKKSSTVAGITNEAARKKISKSPRKDVNKKTKKKKKRSFTDRLNQSIVALIEDPTDEDFEGVPNANPKLEYSSVTHDERKSEDKGQPHQNADIQNKNKASPEKCDMATNDVVMLSDSDGDTAAMECDPPLPAIPSDDSVLSEVFPFFTPHKAFMAGCQVKEAEKDAPPDASGMHRVTTPPPVEELQSALTHLDHKGRLSPVDMLGLIDKWEREKVGSSHSISPPGPTAKEVYPKGKMSIVTTPIRISGAFSRPQKPADVCATDGAKSDKAQESVAADLTEDMFLDGSMVMEEPELTARDNRVEPIQDTEPHRECKRSPMLKASERIMEQRAEDMSRISNASSSPRKSPVPVTPLLPRSSGSFNFRTNTSTPMCNSAATDVEYSPIVKKSSTAKDARKSKETLTKAGENRRKSDPCASPSVLYNKPKAAQPSRRSASPMHDSFFSDLHDDSAFAAMATQSFVVETPPVIKKKSPVVIKSPSSLVERTPIGRAQTTPFSRGTAVTPVSALETSQLTFTQALACVNDSTDTSRSTNSPSPQPAGTKSNLPQPRQEGSGKSNMEVRGPGRVQQRSYPASEVPCAKNTIHNPKVSPTVVKTATIEVPKQEEIPQFDLGFDFDDDFDDEMIVPPSPPRPTTSQGFSLRLKADTTASMTSCLIPNQSALGDKEHSLDTCDTAADNDHPDNISRGSSLSPVLCSVTRQGGAKGRTYESKLPVGNVPPPATLAKMGEVANSEANFSDSLVAIFADNDSEELFCDEEDDWESGQATSDENRVSAIYEKIPVRPSSPVVATSPVKSDFKTPVKPAPRTSRPYKPQVTEATMADDSPILPSQKRRRPVVVNEEEANEDSPIEPPCKRHRPILGLDSDEDSPVRPARARHRTNAIIEDSPIVPPSKQHGPVVGLESDEDSPIAPARARHRIPAIIEDSPVAPPTKRQLPMVWQDSDDDSIVAPARGRHCRKALIDLTADEEDDDDFVSSRKPKRVVTSTKQSSYNVIHEKRSVFPKPKKVSAAAGFLDVEAERSEDDCSEDELDEENDEYEQSFVNDCSQMTQADRGNSPDMRAVYLQSVRSPVRSGGHYRLARPRVDNMDVFSQMPQQDTDYMEDSFVVTGDDSDDHIDDGAEDEISIMDLGPNVTMSRQTRRQARIAQQAPPKAAPRPKIGRRVLRVVDSSSEEEAERIAPSQVPADKRKNTLLSTSSSSSNTSPSPQRPDSSREPPKNRNEKQASAMRLPPVSLKVSPTGIAKLTSLHERCMERLQEDTVKGYNSTRDDKTTSSSAMKLSTARSHVRQVPLAASKPVTVHEDPTFSLGVDFLDMDDNWNDDNDDDAVPDPASPVLQSKQELQPKQTTSARMVDSNISNTSSVSNRTLNETSVSDRERRLQLSRQRQEEFRRKMAAPSASTSASRQSGSHFGSQIHPPSQSPQVTTTRQSDIAPTPTPAPTHSQNVTSLVTPERNAPRGRMVILVDSREINGARELISVLRFKHNAHTVIRQLTECDFIISNRMAVDRILHSIFTNGSRKDKLVKRVRAMCELYDRPCIIVEKDALKADQQQAARPQPHTKYTDSIMAALAQTHVKLLFSNSQEHTAGLMTDLVTQEVKKGQAIRVSTDLTEPQEQMLRFYMSLPRVSYIVALNLVHSFRSVADMVRGTEAQFVKNGKMSQVRATELHMHLRWKFDLQMLSLRS